MCVILSRFTCRGELKYEDLVSKYWPEFGKYGKENVTIEMLMTHRVSFCLYAIYALLKLQFY